ncbi:MAG: hypothetical protein KKE05_00945 [Nanoarchaeota archaeon]|nr:hypothetical protein [Nanoarchaeota archaeon]
MKLMSKKEQEAKLLELRKLCLEIDEKVLRLRGLCFDLGKSLNKNFGGGKDGQSPLLKS